MRPTGVMGQVLVIREMPTRSWAGARPHAAPAVSAALRSGGATRRSGTWPDRGLPSGNSRDIHLPAGCGLYFSPDQFPGPRSPAPALVPKHLALCRLPAKAIASHKAFRDRPHRAVDHPGFILPRPFAPAQCMFASDNLGGLDDMPTPGGPPEPQSPDPAPSDVRDAIAVTGAQQTETLTVLRQLIEMLFPRGDPDKPRLEDLIASLVGQQTRMLILLPQIATDVAGVLDRLAPEGEGRPDRQQAGNGGARR